jgi:hypothetical protein
VGCKAAALLSEAFESWRDSIGTVAVALFAAGLLEVLALAAVGRGFRAGTGFDFAGAAAVTDVVGA